MRQYLDLLRMVLDEGAWQEFRRHVVERHAGRVFQSIYRQVVATGAAELAEMHAALLRQRGVGCGTGRRAGLLAGDVGG